MLATDLCLVSVFRSDNPIMIQRMMSYPLDTKEGELFILPVTLTELQQTSQWKWAVSSNKLLHLVCSCPHGVSMIMFEPGSDLQTDPPSAAPHLSHSMITFPHLENKHKALVKKLICRAGEGRGDRGPTCPEEDRNMDCVIFLILSRDSDLWLRLRPVQSKHPARAIWLGLENQLRLRLFSFFSPLDPKNN